MFAELKPAFQPIFETTAPLQISWNLGADGIKRNKKANGKALDGKIIQMMPELAMR